MNGPTGCQSTGQAQTSCCSGAGSAESWVQFLLPANPKWSMKLAILAVVASTAAAFAPSAGTASTTALNAEAGRREFFSKAAAATAAVVGAAAPANAVIDYENVAYLGGSNIVDINNANVRAYLKMPGMYPTVAGKVVTNGPYATVGDLYKIPGLSSKEAEVLKKYESRFVAKTPSPDYVIDRYNNGLYR